MVHRSILAPVVLLLLVALTSLAQQQVSPVPPGQQAHHKLQLRSPVRSRSGLPLPTQAPDFAELV